MQIGSSVSNRYYTSYQTNMSVKYFAGFSQTEDGKLTPNEKNPQDLTENPGFAEFADYQEFHKAWMSQRGVAKPVEVNKVNPNHATNLEMFALLSYTDKMGITDGGTFGSHQQLEVYGENAAKYIEREKQFYRAFTSKLEGLTGADNIDTEETVDYAKILEEKINEILEKIKNGDTEPTYQIGSQSFTEKEWEKFLDKFDSIQEVIQELMKEEQERKEAEKEKKEDMMINDASTLLITEFTSCVYETANPEDDDIRYITWYTEEGIFCRKAGQTEGYEWAIIFENKEQYDKVMEFIGQFPSDWNMRFAANESFWNDFLNDEIDREGFMEFIPIR